MFSLKGKIALVTGGASGIGAATVKAFVSAGATVYIADRDASAGQAFAAEVSAARQSTDGEARFVEFDVASPESVAAVAAQVIAAHEAVDVLVNNAGVGHVGTILHTEVADLDRLWRVNVLGVFNVSKAFLPSMIARRAGSIVNLASIGGIVGIRDRVGYCTTKFAVVGMTKAMALDHAAAGVRVNCICPGRVQTPFVTARLREYPDPEAAYRDMSSTQALGRMARPEEIAAAALYLASDEAAFVTGSALIADGGWSAGK